MAELTQNRALKPWDLLEGIVLEARGKRIKEIEEEAIKSINNIIPERITFLGVNVVAVISISELPDPQALLRNKEILETIISEYRKAGWVTIFNAREETIEFCRTELELVNALKAKLA